MTKMIIVKSVTDVGAHTNSSTEVDKVTVDLDYHLHDIKFAIRQSDPATRLCSGAIRRLDLEVNVNVKYLMWKCNCKRKKNRIQTAISFHYRSFLCSSAAAAGALAAAAPNTASPSSLILVNPAESCDRYGSTRDRAVGTSPAGLLGLAGAVVAKLAPPAGLEDGTGAPPRLRRAA